jgi:hypothetical protein
MTSSDHSGHQASRSDENATGQAFRQTHPAPDTESPPTPSHLWIAAGLTFTPLILSLATWLAPRLQLSHAAQDLCTFLGAVSTLSISLFLLAQGRLPTRGWIAVGSVAGVLLGFTAYVGVQSAFAITLVGTTLVALGHTIGHAVGSRIEHPGHLLPACVVAGCVDLASVIHPKGPTHAIVSSERALDLLTLSFPVLGTQAFAPSIGVGDMVFAALLLGTAARHQLSTLRFALLITAGLVLAGVLSALLLRAVPALPTIGLCTVLGVRQARHLRPKDRKTATLFMVGAITLGVGVVISRFLA